jgi:hypothetical protein
LEISFKVIYYINVQSPNLDLKQGISYLERERGERDSERERGGGGPGGLKLKKEDKSQTQMKI